MIYLLEMRKILLILLCLVLFSCASGSREVQLRLSELEAKVSSDQLINIVNSFQQLQQKQSQLEGKIDELSRKVDDLSKSQNNLYSDLDTRISNLEGKGSSGDSSSIMSEYSDAIKSLKDRNFQVAEEKLGKFLDKYPTQVPEAEYWYAIAQSASAGKDRSKTNEVIKNLESFIFKNPNNSLYPQALVALADSYLSVSQLDKAKSLYKDFLSKYPNNPLAAKVKENLSKL